MLRSVLLSANALTNSVKFFGERCLHRASSLATDKTKYGDAGSRFFLLHLQACLKQKNDVARAQPFAADFAH
jgi:hypothetical protein